jgi:hypothetical protein
MRRLKRKSRFKIFWVFSISFLILIGIFSTLILTIEYTDYALYSIVGVILYIWALIYLIKH